MTEKQIRNCSDIQIVAYLRFYERQIQGPVKHIRWHFLLKVFSSLQFKLLTA